MEPTAQAPKSVSAGSLAVIFTTGLFLLTLFWIGTQALRSFVTREDDYETRRSAERLEIRDKVLQEADADLNRYAWRNQEEGLLQIPMDRAMELTVAALQASNEIKPAYFIDPLRAAAEQEPPEPAAPVEEPIDQPDPTDPTDLDDPVELPAT